MRPFLRQFVALFTSLRLTVVLLVLSILLVFAATLDQVHLGVWGVQEKYFRSFFIYARVPVAGVSVPIFPAGCLLGGILLINLLAAHFHHFRFRWRTCGIWLTHVGLILLLIGEGLSGMMQEDSQMRIDVGQTRRYAESFRETELAVIDATDPRFDEVVSIPSDRLGSRSLIQHPKMPFAVRPIGFFPNATVRMRNQATAPAPAVATVGNGTEMVVEPAPVTYKENEVNEPAAYVELAGPEGSLGTFLVSTMLMEPQAFSYQGGTWMLVMRPKRDYLPFSLSLLKFTHDVYPGTDIPKDFASTIHLRSDDGRDDRDVRIYMNNPLRYGGRAFYQAGYDNNDRTSVLQVVRNPGWRIPYVSCGLIALGLMVEFGMHLLGFFRRRQPQSAEAPARADPARAG